MRIKDRPEYSSKTKPLTLPPTALVREAIEPMSNHNFGSIVITNADNTIAGIVTERDLMRRLLHENKDPDTTKLSEIMTKNVKSAKPDDYVIDWLRTMSNERFRHLPIVDEDGKLVNIMSQGDFVSYTWPEILDRLKGKVKETWLNSQQVIILVAIVLLYSVIINLAHQG